jgi:general secretion pathway protein M
MIELNARERRLVAILIAVGVVAAAWLLVVSPVIGGFAARQAERQGLLARYQRNQRLLDAVPAWRAEAEGQRQSASAFAVVAPTDLEGRDLLRTRITNAIVASGAPAPNVQDRQGDISAGSIGVRADAVLSQAQLNQSLRRLESEEPYVVVDYLSITAERAFRSGREEPLDVRIDVSAPFHPSSIGQP